MRVRRYDVGILGSWARTPQGGIVVPASLARVGVFGYRRDDGSMRQEYCPPESLFDPASLASLAHAPVTDLHPEIDGQRVAVTPENYSTLSKGTVAGNATRDGDHLVASLVVQAADLLAKIESGDAKECSCGYETTLDETPGTTPQGEKYDAIQGPRVYNHLAIGPSGWGRHGPTVALRTDATQDCPPMIKVKVDGKEYEQGSAAHLAALEAYGIKQQERADAAEAKAKIPDAALVAAAVKARVLLVSDCAAAAKVKGVNFDAEAAASEPDTGAVVLEAIKALGGSEEDIKGQSPDFLSGYLKATIRAITAEAGEETPATETPGADAQPQVTPGVPPKTDSKPRATIFSARQGGPAPRQDGSDTKGDAADQAVEAQKLRNQKRGSEPLSATRPK